MKIATMRIAKSRTVMMASAGIPRVGLSAIFFAAAVTAALPQQTTGPARVAFPTDYATKFVLYNVVDRFDGKHARFMYIDAKSAAAAKPGQPLPDGVVVVMELRAVEQDSAGNVVLDEKGRMKPLAKVISVSVQEKRKGWGEAIAPNLRNGDWDYAAFTAEGKVNEQVKTMDGCFTCHLSRSDRDFTFTTFKNVLDGLPKG